jgi:hypothetical protein
VDEIGITPVRDTSPTVGFIPTSPFTAAGQVTEPSVSVPSAAIPCRARSLRRAELDPHGL